jgi:hypothetical protein
MRPSSKAPTPPATSVSNHGRGGSPGPRPVSGRGPLRSVIRRGEAIRSPVSRLFDRASLFDRVAVGAATPVERLAGALRFETVSPQDPAEFDAAPFLELHRYLALHFPLAHSLEHELVAEVPHTRAHRAGSGRPLERPSEGERDRRPRPCDRAARSAAAARSAWRCRERPAGECNGDRELPARPGG